MALLGAAVSEEDTAGRGDCPSQSERLLTREELAIYHAGHEHIFLAILGEVYNVTNGKQYYGTGMGYAGFSGTDGSRSFVTGNFSNGGIVDDLDALSPEEVAGVVGWRDFYRNEDKYPYIGKLIGRYFDENGGNTPYHGIIAQQMELHETKQRLAALLKKKYPKCNSKWTQKTGKQVWCTTTAKNIARVPRKFTANESTKKPRCACIDLAKGVEAADGAIDTYENCKPDAQKCFL